VNVPGYGAGKKLEPPDPRPVPVMVAGHGEDGGEVHNMRDDFQKVEA
jgi:hypothetical protein